MSSSGIETFQCPSCGRKYPEAGAGDLCPRDGRVLIPEQTLIHYPGDPLLGMTIDGTYRIYDILGMGGFGAVYRAREGQDGRDVAIKTIRPGADKKGADAHARFLQEARLLAELDSERIVDVYHFGVAKVREDEGQPSDGFLYMVLELVEGLSLKRLLRREKTLSTSRTVDIISQILDGLTHAHAHGLVHRDLKPGNILIVEGARDQVKIIDFGIAKVLETDEEEDGPRTGTGLVLGTVRYMAPEQLREGQEIGSHTDLYSVGVMFYEMLVGQTPFDGSQAEIAAAHLYRKPPPLPAPIATPELQNWFFQVMVKSGLERFPDADMMRISLLRAYERSAARRVPDTVRMNSAGLREMLAHVSEREQPDSDRGVSTHDSGDFESEEPTQDSGQSAVQSSIPAVTDEGRSIPDTVRESARSYPKKRSSKESRQAVSASTDRKKNSGSKKKRHPTTQKDVPAIQQRPSKSAGAKAAKKPEPRVDESVWEARSVATSPLPEADGDRLKTTAGHGPEKQDGSSIQTRGELGLLPPETTRVKGSWWLAPGLALLFLLAALMMVHPPVSEHGTAQDVLSKQRVMPATIIDIPAIDDAALQRLDAAPTVSTDSPQDAGLIKADQTVGATVSEPSSGQREESMRPPKQKVDSASTERPSTNQRKLASSRSKKPPKARGRKSTRARKIRRSTPRRAKRSTKKKRKSPPERESQMHRSLAKAVTLQLDKCRCARARVLLDELPSDYPKSRLGALRRKVEACRVPTVDQRCVDGRVE